MNIAEIAKKPSRLALAEVGKKNLLSADHNCATLEHFSDEELIEECLEKLDCFFNSGSYEESLLHPLIERISDRDLSKREKIGAGALQGILANPSLMATLKPDEAADLALVHTDRLIAGLNKE
jgi:hypothetical protein